MKTRWNWVAGVLILSAGWCLAQDAPTVGKEKKEQKEQNVQQGHGWLGVYLDRVPDVLASHLKLKNKEGALVIKVTEKSPAAQAGVEKTDVLLSVEGQPIDNPESLIDKLRPFTVGQKVKLGLIHEGQSKTVEVTLGEKPSEMMKDEAGEEEEDEEGIEGPCPGKVMRQIKVRCEEDSDRPEGPGSERVKHWVMKLGDGEGDAVDVEVKCRNDKGTVIVNHKGHQEVREFPCGDGEDWRAVLKGIGPEGLDLPKFCEGPIRDKFDREVAPRMIYMRKKIDDVLESKRLQFVVAADGSITVTVHKDGNELTKTFRNESELKEQQPKWYGEYEEIMSEMK